MLIQRTKNVFASICVRFPRLLTFACCLGASSLSFGLWKEIPIAEGARLEIIVGKDSSAHVSVLGSTTGAGARSLRFDSDAEVQIKDKGDSVQLVLKGAKGAKSKLEVQGRSVPLTVHLIEGQILLTQWNQDVLLHVQNGKVQTSQTHGILIAHVQKGEIAVSDHTGKVLVDSFQAGISLKGIQGDMEVQSFLGEVQVEKNNGHLNLQAQQAQVHVNSGQGSFDFETVKGAVHVQKFAGRIEGVTQEGELHVASLADQDVRLRTQSGRVVISSPAGGNVDAMSAAGDLIAPAPLKVVHEGASRSLKGKLKGDSTGTLFVRTKEGVISLR
jgi:hypothetical protein